MAVTTFRADIETSQARSKKARRNLILSVLLTTLIVSSVAGWVYWKSLFNDMPTLPAAEKLWTMGRDRALVLKTQDGTTILHRGPVYGKAVRPEDLPEHVINAFIAGEDKRFFEHNGIDPSAIARAAAANWQAGRTVQGGSTLTQQLVKNLLLSPEQTIKRKAQEMRLAMELERQLSKDQILSLYLNRIFLGNRAYGIDGAAKAYFGKRADELTLAEASFLAGLPKAPTRLTSDPDLKQARERQRYVLAQMVNLGHVDLAEAREAAQADISFVDRPTYDPQLGYVADHVAEQLNLLLPTVPADAIVTVTIDPAIQTKVRQALKAKIDARGRRDRVGNGAAVIIDTSGRVLALVGGTDYTRSSFNRATQAMRQPGSAFKPFVYAAALEAGLSPYTVRIDERKTLVGNWAPRNYSNTYVGPVTLRDALANSFNTIAAKLTVEVGQDKVIAVAHRLGLGTDLLSVPSIALGADETTLFDLTRAYGAFARSGQRLDPYIIEKVEDSRGQVLYDRRPYPASKVLNDRVARDMNAMLARVVTRGSGWRANVRGWQVAGKTGTSQKWRDAWFVGYTSTMVAGVWLGNDDNSPMRRVSGGSLPAEIWSTMMTDVLKGTSPKSLEGVDGTDYLPVAQRRRVEFYNELANAFDAVSPTRVAGLDRDQNRQ